MSTTTALSDAIGRLDGTRIELLRRLAADRSIALDELLTLPSPRSGGSYPLSAAQQGVFFLEKLFGPSAAYNVSAVAGIDADLDLELLERAVRIVAVRHEVFRLQFRVAGGVPVQSLADEPRVRWRALRFDRYRREAIQAEIDAEVRAPMSATEGPLLRVLAIKVAGGASHLVATLHHIVSDAWSVRILIRETGLVYTSLRAGLPPELPDLPVQYLDHAIQEQRIRDTARFDERLAGLARRYPRGLPRLALDGGTKRGRGHVRPGAVLEFEAAGAEWKATEAASHALGVTPFVWLLCAWAEVLAGFAWARGVPIAVPVTQRRRPELEPLIGYFSNLVLVPAPDAPDAGLADSLRATRAAVQEALAAQDVPFDELVRRVGPVRRGADTAMYDLMFEYLDFRAVRARFRAEPGADVAAPATRRSEFAVDTGTAKCALFLAVWEEDGSVAGALEYDAELFDARAIEEIRDRYCDELARMAASSREGR